MYLKPIPPAKVLRSYLKYDPISGKLIRLTGSKAGKETGSLNPDGYVYVRLAGKQYIAHRIIWKIVTGKDPVAYLDHIDKNRSNNRWDNLREASLSDNAKNTKIRADNTSGVRGARWHKAAGKFVAEISVNGARKHLGVFETLEQAAEAYDEATKIFHGEFSYLIGLEE